MAAVEGTGGGGLPEEVPSELRIEVERLQRQIKVLLNNYQVILRGQLGNVRFPPENNFLFSYDYYFATCDDYQTFIHPCLNRFQCYG